MRICRFSAVAAALLASAGCASFNITEDFWFNPGFAVLGDDELREAERILPGDPALSAVRFSAADGTPLYGLHMHSDAGRPTVLYFGGDRFRIAEHGVDVLKGFAAMNVNVLMMDYRGYGGSGGEPGLATLQADALEAYRYLRNELKAEHVALHGFSMGSFIASALVDDVTPSLLVLEATATNVPDWADSQVPWYAEPFVTLNIAESLLEQDNRQRLREYDGPLLLIAGARDTTTPLSMSEELLAESATSRAGKRLLVSESSRHGNAMHDPVIIEGYRAFLDNQASPTETVTH